MSHTKRRTNRPSCLISGTSFEIFALRKIVDPTGNATCPKLSRAPTCDFAAEPNYVPHSREPV
jgi:hypothetical protein